VPVAGLGAASTVARAVAPGQPFAPLTILDSFARLQFTTALGLLVLTVAPRAGAGMMFNAARAELLTVTACDLAFPL